MILPLPLLLDQVPCRFANLGVLRKQECELHLLWLHLLWLHLLWLHLPWLHLPWLHLPWLHLTMATLTMVLRKQECERVQALRTELTKCGASVVEEGDTLSVRLRRPRLLPPLLPLCCPCCPCCVGAPLCTCAPLHAYTCAPLHSYTCAPLHAYTCAPLRFDPLQVACTAAAQLGSATVHTYHDHRMAMCFATLGLAVGGVKLEDPSCVRAPRPKKRAA